MSAEDWIKLAAFFVTTVGGGGGVAAAFKWILQPYKDALVKAEALAKEAFTRADDQAKALMLQITNKQSVIDELVQSQIECELADGEKYNWIVAAHSAMKIHGMNMDEVPELPPRRIRGGAVRASYLQRQTAQNTANAVASQNSSLDQSNRPPLLPPVTEPK